MKTLIIVESPHKATTIQEYLGKDYIVTASKGHITELIKKGQYNVVLIDDIETHIHPEHRPLLVVADPCAAGGIETGQHLHEPARVLVQREMENGRVEVMSRTS
jgi:DNA topoisomerase IA